MSVVDICNSALNAIGGNNIISLTEDSKPARILNQRYPSVRDSVFRVHPWNCLITRIDLAPDTAAPSFEYSNQFTLPADCLRIIQAEKLDTVFKVEGRKILCDDDTFNLIYVRREEDTALYDSLLTDTLAAKLAHEIAYAIVQDRTLARMMHDFYNEKLRQARFVDATEGTPGSAEQVTEAGGVEATTFIASRL